MRLSSRLVGLAIVLLAGSCGGGESSSAQTPTTQSASTSVAAPSTVATSSTTIAPTTTAAPSTTVGPTTTVAPTTTAAQRAFPDETGQGVTVAIIDRGIDWAHPDFRNADGTTRIKAILDMSGQNWCLPGNPSPVEYTEQQINDALTNGTSLGTRDAVGHGTPTAGAAAGNGRAATGGANLRGVAIDADLVIIKATSEGAPAVGDHPAEAAFNGCPSDVFTWLIDKLDELDQPAVAIWNIGVQWGPMDGTSIFSREIEAAFGPDTPGRIWVQPAGDEGSLPSHAGGALSADSPLEIPFEIVAPRTFPTAWVSGETPANITIELDNGVTLGPVRPGGSASGDGITLTNYLPGQSFYPWTSNSGDSAVWMSIDGFTGSGLIRFETTAETDGRVDIYGDLQGGFLKTAVEFDEEYLLPGRANDLVTTIGVIGVGVYVERSVFEGADGVDYDLAAEGDVGDLWLKSPGGPSRDGRQVIDIAAPGQNAPASAGADSVFTQLAGNLLRGNEQYVRFGGTSGAAPIVVGAVALMLEANPELTADEARDILRATAIQDEFTGEVPNQLWGWGKLDIVAAVEGARNSNG